MTGVAMNVQDAGGTPIRLLLIEGDPGDARLFEEALKGVRPSYDVVVASSLAQAVEIDDGSEFLLVLSDLGLPDSSGLETFLQCKSHWPDTPIVLLSGLADEAVAQEAVATGAQDYLVKGDMNPRALRRALQYAIERHRNAEERRFLARELEQSRKLEAIGQLAAGIAHEINTPTQYVSDNTRFLKDAVSDLVCTLERVREYAEDGRPAPAAELVKLLEEADVEYLLEELPRAVSQSLDGLEHIARIVRAMKEFSHPATDEKTPTDLNKAIETTVVVASNEWKYVAEIEADLAPDLPAVACLPGEINQVFLNLIVNAAHAIADVVGDSTEGKGRIRIVTGFDDDAVRILVEDTGTGIAPEHRGKIFEPFFTTKEIGKGTGQGLAIAYDVVVNKHGGSIAVDSAEGRGTSFVIRLPIRASEDSPRPRAEVA